MFRNFYFLNKKKKKIKNDDIHSGGKTMDTIIKDTLSQHKIMLDQNCKLMISHEEMLSRIIKEFVEEAKHLSIEEIIKIVQDEHRFQRLNNENSIPGYGTVRFDFFGCIDLPQLDHTIKRIYLNVEIQNDAYPNILS